MSLQDIPAYSGMNSQDPTLSNPYDPSDPRYVQYQLNYLLPQLYGQANKDANAKGALYSGGTAADEQQAASSLGYQLASNQSAQALQEQQLLQQEAFQAQQQAAQNQASADVAAKQNKAGMVSSGLGAGLQGAGSMGALYYMMHGAPVPGVTPSVAETYGYAPASARYLAASGVPESELSAAAAAPYSAPYATGVGGGVAPGATEGAYLDAVGEAGASGTLGATGTAAAPTGLASLGMGSGAGALGLGALGGYGGYQIGGGNTQNNKIGGAAGGLAGALGGAALAGPGMMALGPWGTAGMIGLGAFGGSALGKQLGGLF